VIALLAEAGARSIVLGLICHAGLALTRTHSAHVQKTAWTTMMCASLIMPLLLYLPLAPTIPAPSVLVRSTPSLILAGPRTFGWLGVVSSIYWVIAATLTFRYAMGMVRMWAIRRSARRLSETWAAGLDVRATDRMAVPATFGSSVLLPADFETWSKPKREAVIAHERSHVVERDCYVLWLARLYTCLFWFNPIAWWVQRKVAALAEATSDDAAVGITGDRPAYAEILLEFAQYGRTAGGAVAPMARSSVSHRIERIVSETSSSRMPTLKRRLLAIAALLPMVILAALPLKSAAVGTARANANAGAPRITSYDRLAELSRYYPAEARRRGIEGVVVVAVTLDAQGLPTDTRILSEDPPEMGFGAAASAAAHAMEYSNPTGHRVQFPFRVRFALDNPDATPADGASQP
jgi:TonB family protein